MGGVYGNKSDKALSYTCNATTSLGRTGAALSSSVSSTYRTTHLTTFCYGHESCNTQPSAMDTNFGDEEHSLLHYPLPHNSEGSIPNYTP